MIIFCEKKRQNEQQDENSIKGKLCADFYLIVHSVPSKETVRVPNRVYYINYTD